MQPKRHDKGQNLRAPMPSNGDVQFPWLALFVWGNVLVGLSLVSRASFSFGDDVESFHVFLKSHLGSQGADKILTAAAQVCCSLFDPASAIPSLSSPLVSHNSPSAHWIAPLVDSPQSPASASSSRLGAQRNVRPSLSAGARIRGGSSTGAVAGSGSGTPSSDSPGSYSSDGTPIGMVPRRLAVDSGVQLVVFPARS